MRIDRSLDAADSPATTHETDPCEPESEASNEGRDDWPEAAVFLGRPVFWTTKRGERRFKYGSKCWAEGKYPGDQYLEAMAIPRDGRTAGGSPQSSDVFAGLTRLQSAAHRSYDALYAATPETTPWVWHGIIAQNHLCDLVGKPHGGKSTFAYFLAVAIANPTGKPVLLFGRAVTPAPPGKVVIFIQEENGGLSVRRKIEHACQALGLPVKETVDRLVLLIRKDVVMGDPVWTDICQLTARGAVGALFIDSRARVLGIGDANSERDQADIAARLYMLIEGGQMPVFVVSHTRKGARTTIEDIAGSGQRGAASDTIIFVNPNHNKVGKVISADITVAKSRDDIEDHPGVLRYAFGADKNGVWSVDVLANRVDTVGGSSKKELLLAFIRAKGPTGKETLKKVLRMSGASLRELLDGLKREDAIRFVKDKNKKLSLVALPHAATSSVDRETASDTRSSDKRRTKSSRRGK